MIFHFLSILVPVVLFVGAGIYSVILLNSAREKRIKLQISSEEKIALIELKVAKQKDVLNVRLQAYERLVLFLERISPNSLVLRVSKPGFTALQLQKELVRSIREEFEHNLAQQIYVSQASWDVLVDAKDEIVRLVTETSIDLTENATGLQMAQKFIERSGQMNNDAIKRALIQLKAESADLF